MDGQQFDELVRVAAIGANRRQVLRALAVGLAGSLVFPNRKPGVAAQDAGAQGPAKCATDSDCVDPDTDPCTGATCEGGTCAFFIVDCIPGYVCCGNGECCPDTGSGQCQSDADCAEGDGDPCTGARCENGACTYHIATCAPGFVCCGNGECCPEAADGGNTNDQGSTGEDAIANGESDSGAVDNGTAGGGPVQLPNTGSGGPAPARSKTWLAPFALIGTGVALIVSRLRWRIR